MPQRNSNISQFLPCALLLLALLTTACSTTQPARTTIPERVAQQQGPEEILARATQSPNSSVRNTLLLEAAQLYWDNGLAGQAFAIIKDINPDQLPAAHTNTWLQLGLEIGLALEDKLFLDDILQPERINYFIAQSPIDTQKNLVMLVSDGYLALDRGMEAAVVLSEHTGLFEADELDHLNNLIWSALTSIATADLTRTSYAGGDSNTREWIELATQLRLLQSSLEEQYHYLTSWFETHPSHSATIFPPFELQVLTQLPHISPNTVTLALPFSGPLANVAEAIRDGFMASYYQQPRQQNLRIEMFDTHMRALTELYQQHDSGQHLIIGPLEKDKLQTLAGDEQLSIPTLALNTLDPLSTPPDLLFQFSLAAEHEAAQVARHLAQSRLNRVAIIGPDDAFGNRIEQIFRASLQEWGGTVIASARYADQSSLSATVSHLLATDKSTQRARKLRSITQLSLQSEPRRRQDIDAIFMLAKPAIGRQLKPLFAFHYAKQLPVYSISQIHARDGQPNDDLNGVRFVEMPWMLSNTHPIKASLNQHTEDQAQRYARFNALGADAHVLSSRLPLLQQLPDSRVSGQSGLLSLNTRGTIERELQWAMFKNGAAIAIQE